MARLQNARTSHRGASRRREDYTRIPGLIALDMACSQLRWLRQTEHNTSHDCCTAIAFSLKDIFQTGRWPAANAARAAS
jgi:glucose dehydrogenase